MTIIARVERDTSVVTVRILLIGASLDSAKMEQNATL